MLLALASSFLFKNTCMYWGTRAIYQELIKGTLRLSMQYQYRKTSYYPLKIEMVNIFIVGKMENGLFSTFSFLKMLGILVTYNRRVYK